MKKAAEEMKHKLSDSLQGMLCLSTPRYEYITHHITCVVTETVVAKVSSSSEVR